MKRVLFFVVFSLCLSTFCSAQPLDFYVSTQGRDLWSGRLPAPDVQQTDGPFATLEGARQAIRDLKKAGRYPADGVTVSLREGIYMMEKSFLLTAEDSGAPTGPVVYRAYPGEEVRLVGGRTIEGFTPLTDSPVVDARIDPNYRRHILQINLKSLGIENFGQMFEDGRVGMEVFFQDRPMPLAKWPNDGYDHIAKLTDEQKFQIYGLDGSKAGKFYYQGDRPNLWLREDDIRLEGYWFWDWASQFQTVESIDPAARLINLAKPWHGHGYRLGQRWRAFNLLAELDEPGEWYLDRRQGILYFWPPAALEQGRVVISLLKEPIITLEQASYITIRGLILEDSRGLAILITGGEHNLAAGCIFRNLGDGAVRIQGGKNHSVLSCDIYYTGKFGVHMEGGDRLTLMPAGHVVENCHIHDYSRWIRTYAPAVYIAGVGNRVTHNLIHDAPHIAVMLLGNDHLLEYNNIYHVCMETNDAGAFYMGRDWTYRGNVVQYNYFHELGRGDVNAIYLDDFTCGTMVRGNVCQAVTRAVLIGGGRDNTVVNNVFADCKKAVHIDQRGLGWAKSFFDGTDNTMFDRLKAVNGTQPPYSEKYPPLATILDDEPAKAKENKIINNVFSRCGQWLQLHDGLKEDTPYLTIRDNFREGDPGFVNKGDIGYIDALNMDCQLRDDSPVYHYLLSFKKIPLTRIGILPDEYRAAGPVDRAKPR